MKQIDYTSLPQLRGDFKLDIVTRAAEGEGADRTIEFSASSNALIDRYFVYEQLMHGAENIDTTRFDGMPILDSHKADKQIGVVEGFRIDGNKLYVTARFSRSKDADEIYTDIVDGIRKNVSIGYRILSAAVGGQKDGKDIIVVDRWMPVEVSTMSVAADPSVGIGRGDDIEQFFKNLSNKRSEENMDPVQGTVTPITGGASAEDLEKRRVEEIRALAEKQGEDPEWALRGDTSVEAYKNYLIYKRGKQTKVMTDSIETVENGQGSEQYSIVRGLRSLITGENSVEREISQSLFKKGEFVHSNQRGLILPFGLQVRGDVMTFGTTNEGKEFVPTNLKGDRLIDSLEAQTITGKIGVQLLPGLTGIIDIPKVVGNFAPTGKAENAQADKSKVGSTTIRLEPKRITVKVPLSQKLLMNGGFDVEGFVRSKLDRALMRVADSYYLNGTGGDLPLGILLATGIHKVSGIDFTFATATEMEGLVLDSDVKGESMFYIMRASNAGKLKTKTMAKDVPPFLITNGVMNGYGVVPTSLMDADKVLFGDYSNTILATFGNGIELIYDNVTEADKGIVNIIATLWADVGVEHVEAIAWAENFS